jgi:hypothetical protein
LSFCHFDKITAQSIYNTSNKVYHGGLEMRLIKKVSYVAVMMSFLLTPLALNLMVSGSEECSTDFGDAIITIIYDRFKPPESIDGNTEPTESIADRIFLGDNEIDEELIENNEEETKTKRRTTRYVGGSIDNGDGNGDGSGAGSSAASSSAAASSAAASSAASSAAAAAASVANAEVVSESNTEPAGETQCSDPILISPDSVRVRDTQSPSSSTDKTTRLLLGNPTQQLDTNTNSI